jgi:glutamate synthase (NADPH/NADH) large chain
MLLVDTKQKKSSPTGVQEVLRDREPYGEWLDRNLLHLEALPIPNKKIHPHAGDARQAVQGIRLHK